MQFHGMTRRKLQNYLQKDFYLNQIEDHSPNDLQKIFNFHKDKAKSLHAYLNHFELKNKNYQLFNQYKPLTIFDDEFPDALRNIPDPPLLLYWQGNKKLLKTPKLSVIGTRKPSQFARKKVDRFLKPLVNRQVTIVSGLAYGIDAMGHQFALDHGGQTIAILGFGFNHLYPAKHRVLFQQIIEHGLILSEYHPDTRPQKWHFPERNRIISGISLATLIIEASERSGTIITADQALEQGKDVFAIPDSIFLDQAQGCLKLIQEGAIPLIKPEEIEDWLDTNSN